MKKRKIYSILLILLPLLAVILIAMPGAMVMRFYAGPNGFFLREVSGFNRVLIGYAQPFPFMAGISGINTVIFALRGPDVKRVRSFAAAGAIFWCIAGAMGGFTGLGIGAMVLLALTAGLAHGICREERL